MASFLWTREIFDSKWKCSWSMVSFRKKRTMDVRLGSFREMKKIAIFLKTNEKNTNECSNDLDLISFVLLRHELIFRKILKNYLFYTGPTIFKTNFWKNDNFFTFLKTFIKKERFCWTTVQWENVPNRQKTNEIIFLAIEKKRINERNEKTERAHL